MRDTNYCLRLAAGGNKTSLRQAAARSLGRAFASSGLRGGRGGRGGREVVLHQRQRHVPKPRQRPRCLGGGRRGGAKIGGSKAGPAQRGKSRDSETIRTALQSITLVQCVFAALLCPAPLLCGPPLQAVNKRSWLGPSLNQETLPALSSARISAEFPDSDCKKRQVWMIGFNL